MNNRTKKEDRDISNENNQNGDDNFNPVLMMVSVKIADS